MFTLTPLITALATAVVIVFATFNNPAFAADAKSAAPSEWERTVEAAKKEAKLNVYLWHGSDLEKVVQRFEKKYPDIKLTTVGGRGSSFITRITSEIRAGKYIADVCICGVTSPFKIFYEQMKALEPLKPALMLPEVKDESKWWQGKQHYQDPVGKYLFIYLGSPSGTRVFYNSTQVNPSEFKSYWDLLTPKWKGKIIAIDPNESSGGWRQLYYHPDLGEKYVRTLLTDMDLAASRDERQTTDWLVQGKYAMALFSRGVPEAKAQGLPVDEVKESQFKEAPSISSGANGTIALMSNAPHPNAAKVFVNWFLSREGQTAVQEIMNSALDQNQSMRNDLPLDPVPVDARRRDNLRYMPIFTPEAMDAAPVLKLYKELMKK
ncbi:MAG: Extracellular solute-binding protein [Deltaproteobacteria bacterium]|nr:Extracellular solute-binding protein [Deltaproteobacteria bacterium]